MKYSRVLMWLIFMWPVIASAEPAANQLEIQETVIDEESSETLWHFQSGLFYRAGGNRFMESEQTYVMGSLDISWLDFNKNRSAWGVGIHGAFSDLAGEGMRFGPRVLYRVPLSKPAGSFLQASTGLYLFGFNNTISDYPFEARLNYPGYFLDTEYGISNNFSVVLGTEILPTDVTDVESVIPAHSHTATNYWVGVRAGQKSASIPILVVGILFGVVFVAIGNSGVTS